MIPVDFTGVDRPWARALARLYGLGYRVWRHHVQRQPQVRAPIPTISVGGVTVGGAGKTPMVAYLATLLRAWGHRPVVLSRGYGGTARGPARVPAHGDPRRWGDEPVLLARMGIPVWIAKVREAGVAYAAREGDVLILDDGFQRLRIARDVDLVMIGPDGLGNGRMLPAGTLRAPLTELARADLFCGAVETLRGLYPEIPRFRFAHRGVLLPPQLRPGTPVAGLAAIAAPRRFQRALEAAGLEVRRFWALPDHDPLELGRQRRLADELAALGLRWLVVTTKDAVKLPPRLGPARVVAAPSDFGPLTEEDREGFARFLRARLVAPSR